MPNLTKDTTYQFRVRARNTLGIGTEAGLMSAIPVKLAHPTIFRVLNGTRVSGVYEITERDPQLDWDMPDEAAGG